MVKKKKSYVSILKVHLFPAEGADETKSEFGFNVRSIIVYIEYKFVTLETLLHLKCVF